MLVPFREISYLLKLGSHLILWIVIFSPALEAQYQAYNITTETTMEQYSDTLQFISGIKNIVNDYRTAGYLLANVDSVTFVADEHTAYIYQGEKYSYGNIALGEAEQTIINAAGLRRYNWSSENIDSTNLQKYMETVIRYLENNGYPFASAGLDSVSVVDGNINANLQINKGKFIVYDSLVVHGDVNISEAYLRNYLEIKKGAAFNKSKYDQVQKRLRELPFLEITQSPEIRFYSKNAVLHLHLKKKQSNRFDFLIGVLPSTVNGVQQFNITGEFTAELHNRLGSGEYVYASFERLRPEVLELELRAIYPYIGGLPVGIHTDLKVYKRSNDFLEAESNIGIDYQLTGQSHLLVGWQLESSRLINVDSSIILADRLPTNLDVQTQGGKLGFNYQNLDYRWNPSSGVDLKVSTSIGQKSIIKNETILELNPELEAAYDTLKLKTLQVQSHIEAAYYIPLASVITLKTSLRGGLLINEKEVFENEYFRLGGNKLLRGFDEQSVLAQGYGLFTTEVRLLLNRNSYLTLPFIDFGYTQVSDGDELIWDQVLGVGLGINFSTPAGLFNVSFASGSRLQNSLDFSNPKVHFGYVSLF